MRCARALIILPLAIPTAVACNRSDSTVATTLGPSPVQPPASTQPAPADSRSYFGYVMDTAGRPISGARIEAVDGPQAGYAMISNAEGQFSVPYSFDQTVTFRASKDDYGSCRRGDDVVCRLSGLTHADILCGYEAKAGCQPAKVPPQRRGRRRRDSRCGIGDSAGAGRATRRVAKRRGQQCGADSRACRVRRRLVCRRRSASTSR